MNIIENPACFQANSTVMAEIQLQESWHRENTKMNKRIFIYLFFQTLVGLIILGVSNFPIVRGVLILILITVVVIAVLFEWSEKRADRFRPRLNNLDEHMSRLYALDRLTGVRWQDFGKKPRFAERVVTPYLVAYRAGCVELIKWQHKEESRGWYERYRELYKVAYELTLLPLDAPPEPETYEQIDDSVFNK